MTARTLAPFDPEVIRPWRLGDGPRGALLIHGFASTPPELRRLGEVLASRGFRCSAPMLPGHGTTPQDLERTRWQVTTHRIDHRIQAVDGGLKRC